MVESWGLLPWWISWCPGGGRLPSLLTHNPLQTPLVLSNPPVVDNSTVRKKWRPLYPLFAVFISLPAWSPLFLPSKLSQRHPGYTKCNFNEPCQLLPKLRNSFSHALSFLTLGRQKTTYHRAMWIRMLWLVRLVQKQGIRERGKEGGWQGMLGEDVPQIR